MRKVLTGLQVFTVLLGVGGTVWALLLLAVGGMVMFNAAEKALWDTCIVALVCLAAVVIVSLCCYRALGCFYRMCARLKDGPAFTDDNCRSLARAARQCAIAGAALGIALTVLAVWSWISPTWISAAIYAIPFAFLTIALMLWAVHLLMQRALRIQEENDLTV